MKNFLVPKKVKRFFIGFFIFSILSIIFWPFFTLPYYYLEKLIINYWHGFQIPYFFFLIPLMNGIIGGLLWIFMGRLSVLMERVIPLLTIKNIFKKPIKLPRSRGFKIGFLIGAISFIIIPFFRTYGLVIFYWPVSLIMCKGWNPESCNEAVTLLIGIPAMIFGWIPIGIIGGLIGILFEHLLWKIKVKQSKTD